MTKEEYEAANLPEPGTVPDASRYLNEEQKERRDRLWEEMLAADMRGESMEPYAEALADLAQEAKRMYEAKG